MSEVLGLKSVLAVIVFIASLFIEEASCNVNPSPLLFQRIESVSYPSSDWNGTLCGFRATDKINILRSASSDAVSQRVESKDWITLQYLADNCHSCLIQNVNEHAGIFEFSTITNTRFQKGVLHLFYHHPSPSSQSEKTLVPDVSVLAVDKDTNYYHLSVNGSTFPSSQSVNNSMSDVSVLSIDKDTKDTPKPSPFKEGLLYGIGIGLFIGLAVAVIGIVSVALYFLHLNKKRQEQPFGGETRTFDDNQYQEIAKASTAL